MSAHDHLGIPLLYPGRVAGNFAKPPRGCIIHSSRSGINRPAMEEFTSTARWAANPNNQYGWNLTIGPNVWVAHMRATQYGINAGTKASSEYLAVEFSQARLGDPIVQEQVTAFAAAWRAYIVPVWPHLGNPATLLLPAHSETIQGVEAGKSDVWPRGSAELEQFRARLYAALRGTGPNADAALAAYAAAHPHLGAARWAGVYARDWAGEKIVRHERGVLAYVNGSVADVTGQVLDDWETDHVGTPATPGDLQKY